jgi:1,4-alpha-glucan branching enzyme
MILSPKDLDALVNARHEHPHSVLGMHPLTHQGKSGLVVRALVQNATSCEVMDAQSRSAPGYAMEKIHPLGLFEVFIPERDKVFRYRLRVERGNGETREFFDAYSFLPTLGQQDLYLFNEGTEHRIYEKLGAHPRVIDGIPGVSFAVWAPNAMRVSVVGDFNHWDGRFLPMRMLGSSGVWELFVPGLETGQFYKYEILPRRGLLRLKTDPYATFFESPPNNASIVYPLDRYQWNDADWLNKRASTDWLRRPVSIYEAHLGSWKRAEGNRPLSYREIAGELVKYVKEMGYTHVEFMPLSEYPFDGSWGYQVTGFFAPTHRYGTPEDFMYLVDTLHQNDIGVLLDWVPAHFPKDFFALPHFDGTHLYEHSDPRQGEHQDWGTLIFNYGRPEVRCFLVGSALAWLDRYHIDGLRVDAVASMLYLDYSRKPGQWIPNKYGGRENLEAIDFLRYTNQTVHKYYPGVLMVAEESTAWGGVSKPVKDGGLGFDLKWNMGWMHDTLEYFKKDPIYRKYHHNQLTFGMIYQHTEKFVLVFSHDEVVHGKCSLLIRMGAEHIPQKAQTLRALFAWMWGWPGKKALFMGSDFGQSAEWGYDRSLDWHLLQYMDHEGVRRLVSDLNHFYLGHPALGELDYDQQAFQWINNNDGNNSIISFVRFGHVPEEAVVVVSNFTPTTRDVYRVGVPYEGQWKEILNTSVEKYGGSAPTNGEIAAQPIKWDGRKFAVDLKLPGLTTLYFQLQPSKEAKPSSAPPAEEARPGG